MAEIAPAVEPVGHHNRGMVGDGYLRSVGPVAFDAVALAVIADAQV